MAVFHGGFEFPVLHGFDSFFVETHTEAAQHANIAGTAVGSHDQAESADALVFRFARLFGEFRLGRVNLARGRNAAAYVEDSSTGTTALSWTKTRALAGTNPTAAAGTNAAAGASTIRGQ